MPRGWYMPALLAVAWTCFSGCARHDCCRHSATVMNAGYELLAIERGKITAEVPALEATPDGEQVPAVPTPERTYVALAAAECQCLAVEHSMLGNLLDRERCAVDLNDLKKSEQPA